MTIEGQPADPSVSRGFTLVLVTLIGAASIGNGWLIHSLHDTGHWTKYLLLAKQASPDRLADVSVPYLLGLKALRAAALPASAVIPIQFVALALTALMLGRTALRTFGPAAALVTALVVMQNRAALVSASEAEVETFILLFNAAGLMLLLLRPKSRFRAGLLFGISIALRPVALLPTVAVSLRSRPRSGRLRFLGAAILLPATVLLIAFLLTGKLSYMSPGKVFYEGMNPKASGLAWEDPSIVRDLSAGRLEPDFQHVAFRIVAAKAGSRNSTLFWTGKAVAYMRAFPGRAFRLTIAKIRLAFSSRDIFDVIAMKNKAEALPGFLYAPYSLLIGLALVGIVTRIRESAVHLLLLYLAGYLTVLALFFVTARLRSPLLPALALLAGAGVEKIYCLLHDRRFLAVALPCALGLAATLSLCVETNLSRESRYRGEASDSWNRLVTEASMASRAGDVERMMRLRARASTFAAGVPLSVPASLVSEAIASEPTGQPPARLFDLALAATAAGDARSAAELLSELRSYRPQRGSDCHGCLALQRARISLRTGREQEANQHLAAARLECPADDAFLALLARTTADRAARTRADQLLDRLYDPFTAALARALAAEDTNHPGEAAALAVQLAERFPQWRTPRILARRFADEALNGDAPFAENRKNDSAPRPLEHPAIAQKGEWR